MHITENSDIPLAATEKLLSNEANQLSLERKQMMETPLPIANLNLYPIHGGTRQCQCI